MAGVSIGTCLTTGHFYSVSIYKLYLEKPRKVVCIYVVLCMSAAMAAVPARKD